MPVWTNEMGDEIELPVGKTPADMRDEIDAANKAARAAEAEKKKLAEELAPVRAQRAREALTTDLSAAGLPPEAADAWLDSVSFKDLERTPENIAAFAQRFSFASSVAPEDSTGTEDDAGYTGSPSTAMAAAAAAQMPPSGANAPVLAPAAQPAPATVKSDDAWALAKRGDEDALTRIAEAEVRKPGTIVYKHPEALIGL